MNRPIIYTNTRTNEHVAVDSLRTFLKEVYKPNTKFMIQDFEVLFKRTNYLKHKVDKLNKTTTNIWLTLGLTIFLGVRKMNRMDHRIKELEAELTNLKNDIFEDIEYMKDDVSVINDQIQNIGGNND